MTILSKTQRDYILKNARPITDAEIAANEAKANDPNHRDDESRLGVAASGFCGLLMNEFRDVFGGSCETHYRIRFYLLTWGGQLFKSYTSQEQEHLISEMAKL